MVFQLAECLGTILREEASKLKTSPTKLPVRRRTINRIKDVISDSESCDLVSNINFLLADIDRLILCERSEVKALRITTDKITRLVNHELSKNRLTEFDNILALINLECRFNVDVNREWVDGNLVITAKVAQSDALNEYCKVQLDWMDNRDTALKQINRIVYGHKKSDKIVRVTMTRGSDTLRSTSRLDTMLYIINENTNLNLTTKMIHRRWMLMLQISANSREFELTILP